MTPPGDPHRLEARSETAQRLFEDLARQLFSRLIDPQEVGATLREKIGVEGESLDQLLSEWITTLLDLLKVQKMVLSQFHVTALQTPENGPYSIQAEVVGELFDPHRHTLTPDALRLSCRQLHLRKDTQGYYAEILLNA